MLLAAHEEQSEDDIPPVDPL
jgi:hypothetical protein